MPAHSGSLQGTTEPPRMPLFLPISWQLTFLSHLNDALRRRSQTSVKMVKCCWNGGQQTEWGRLIVEVLGSSKGASDREKSATFSSSGRSSLSHRLGLCFLHSDTVARDHSVPCPPLLLLPLLQGGFLFWCYWMQPKMTSWNMFAKCLLSTYYVKVWILQRPVRFKDFILNEDGSLQTAMLLWRRLD